MYSQIGQDEWVLRTIGEKENGVFVDIGCGHPEYISNTLVFEKKYNWRGIGVDLSPHNWDFIPPHLCHAEMNPFEYSDWGNRKNTTVYAADAIQLDYAKIFEENDFPDVIDYMSIDLEPPDLTLECLYSIPFDKYKFRCITFETDSTRNIGMGGPLRVKISRDFFESKGYDLVESNVQDDYYVLRK